MPAYAGTPSKCVEALMALHVCARSAGAAEIGSRYSPDMRALAEAIL